MTTRAALPILAAASLAAACNGEDRRHGGPGKPTPTQGGATTTAAASIAPSGAPAGPRTSPRSRKKPNIVFLLADDQRLDAAACMPLLHERIAKKGVTFRKNFASTPLCCPGRSTILTGLYAHNHGVITNGDIEDEGEPDDEPLPGAVAFRAKGNDDKVFARWLRQAGYRTGYFGKYLNGFGKLLKKEPGYIPPHWDQWSSFREPEYYDFQLVERAGEGATRVTCYLTNRKGLPHAKKSKAGCVKGADEVVDGRESYSTDVLADKAIDFIRDSAKRGQPFFVHLAVKAPHGPFESPERYQPDLGKVEFTEEAMKRLGACPLFDWKDRPASFLEQDVSDKPEWVQDLAKGVDAAKADKLRKKQLVSVLATEDALVRITDVLAELHLEGDTVLVYTGDNGYSWGERSYLGKNCAYDECAMVPLYAYDPRNPAGGKALDVFSMNIDLAPTFADLAGVEPGPKVDGQSLAAAFAGDASGFRREHVLTECWGLATKAHPDIHAAVRSTDWKYVEHYQDTARQKLRTRRDGAPETELYHLAKDPSELDNLLRLPEDRLKALGTTSENARQKAAELAKVLHQMEAM